MFAGAGGVTLGQEREVSPAKAQPPSALQGSVSAMSDGLAAMFDFGPQVLEVIVRCIVIYGFLVVAFRLAGKRELGQMTPFDLVLILVISNSVQNAMVGTHTSVTAGLLAAATLFGLNLALGTLKQFSDKARVLLEGTPTVLVRDGKPLPGSLARESISEAELEAAIREHGYATVAEVDLAVLEIDGSISVLRFQGETARRTRKHFRALRNRPL
jgi:uncharacterized membrane protein YcaP (DUF421 family)